MNDQQPEGGWLLLTNDDGIEAPGFRMLAQALNRAGHAIIAFAPSENNSAAGMRINLMQPMKLRPRNDLKDTWGGGRAPLLDVDARRAGAAGDRLVGARRGRRLRRRRRRRRVPVPCNYYS